jgi:hypothetical protein
VRQDRYRLDIYKVQKKFWMMDGTFDDVILLDPIWLVVHRIACEDVRMLSNLCVQSVVTDEVGQTI